MMNMIAGVLVIGFTTLGCKAANQDNARTGPSPKQTTPTVASAPSIATTPSAATMPFDDPGEPGDPPMLSPRPGESYAPSIDLTLVGGSPVGWNGSQLGWMFAGDSALALAAVTGGTRIEFGRARLDPAYSGAYGVVENSDGTATMLVSSTGGSSDPGFVAAWHIKWDAAAERPVVIDHGTWSGADLVKVPSWAKVPAGMPAMPAAPAVSSEWPAGCRVEEPELAGIPASAHATVRELSAALVANDPARLAPLVATQVKLDGKKLGRDAAIARVNAEGPQAVIGFEPDIVEMAGGPHCGFGLRANRSGSDVEIYTGSGYGSTRVLYLGERDGAWRILRVETKDLGAP